MGGVHLTRVYRNRMIRSVHVVMIVDRNTSIPDIVKFSILAASCPDSVMQNVANT